MTNLSVTIIAKNEAKYLVKCLNSVRALTDDIVVVVDKSSTDATLSIAKKYADHVTTRTFTNFSDQKNYAVSLARHPWILALDADETISPSLASEIMSTLKSPKHIAYAMPRINFLFGRAIMHTNWAPQQHTQVWLFNKHHAKWEGPVHEHVIPVGSVGKLTFAKLHINFDTVEEFIANMNQYSTLEAESKPKSYALILFYPLWKFIRHYLVYQGYLDGWHGLYLSYLMGLYGLTVSLKACLKQS